MIKFVCGMITSLIILLLAYQVRPDLFLKIKENRIETIRIEQSPPEVITKIVYKNRIKTIIKELNSCKNDPVIVSNFSSGITNIRPESINIVQNIEKNNQFALIIGSGPTSLKEKKINSSSVEIDQNLGFVFGLDYRRVVDSWVVGGSVLNNQTVLLNMGKKF